jgi:chemotaxis response regulator CheB
MMIERIRVAVAYQPRLMRELVLETITEQPDIEIVAEIQSEEEIASVVEGTRPDCLIISLDESNQLPPLCNTLLHRHPEMKILAIASERNNSILFWASIDIHSHEVEASEAGLLGALRQKGKFVEGWTCE